MQKRPTLVSALTPPHEQRIRDNIYSAAHDAITHWSTFKWHYTDGNADAHVPHSSQAFCISVWGTFASPRGNGVRKAVASILKDTLFQKALEPYDARVPLELESDSRELLNEYGGKQSHLDGVIKLDGLSVVVESKLFEALGACSQAKEKHCSGIYGAGSDLKLETRIACRLEGQEGSRTPRLYWDVMKPISTKDAYQEGKPCPFAGGGYQVMRNIAAAAKLAGQGRDWRVIFAYPQSSDSETGNLIALVKSKLACEQQHRILTLDYVKLAKELITSEDATARGLGEHMATRLSRQIPQT
jgi:hypothetical protein